MGTMPMCCLDFFQNFLYDYYSAHLHLQLSYVKILFEENIFLKFLSMQPLPLALPLQPPACIWNIFAPHFLRPHDF